MGKHTDRVVFNVSHRIVIGWPSTFNVHGRADLDTEVTEFYVNVPAAEFLYLEKFKSDLSDEITFYRQVDYPYLQIGCLPGKPVDPYAWMYGQFLRARITPMRLGIFMMRMRYTGLIPGGMHAGDRMTLTLMFMAVSESYGRSF